MALCLDISLIPGITQLIFTVALLIGCVYILHKFISYQKQSKQSATGLYWIGLIYVIITVIACIIIFISIMDYLFSCFQLKSIYQEELGPAFYGLQIGTLWIVFFYRVYICFKDSVYAMSKYTVYGFILFFITMLSLVIIVIIPIWNEHSQPFRNGLIAFAFLITFIFCVWISVFFIYKLYKVFKGASTQNDDDRLLSTINKVTILSVWSIIATLFTVTSWSLTFVNYSTFMRIVYNIIIMGDITINLICVILMYRAFESWYVVLCGCIDKKCKSCCNQMIQEVHVDVRTVRSLSVDSAMDENKSSNISSGSDDNVVEIDTNQQ